ncbi:MAG: GNAT family N-acetyltransferase [Candidatus Hodarchaeota archaeon]
MNNILNKISSKTIKAYIEQNIDDFYTKSSQHPNFISHLEDKISWVDSRNADWPKCIYRADFEKLNAENEISDIKRLIQEGKAPNGWTIGPLTKPDNLGLILEKNGFVNVYQQSGMAANLKDLKKKILDDSKLLVEIVDNEDSLKNWITVVSSVFGIKIDSELIIFLFLEPEVKFYIGNFKGKMVSALILYLSSGVAGLHAVSTLSEYRNRGFGLTISRAALIDALKNDYKVGVLQASSLGERVYRKLGFKKYCDIISYELSTQIN